MEKLTRLIPVGILLVYLLKCLITGPQPVDAAILGIFAALAGYAEYKSEEKHILALKSEIAIMKSLQTDMIKQQEELRSHVSSMKIGLNMRSGSLTGKING